MKINIRRHFYNLLKTNEILRIKRHFITERYIPKPFDLLQTNASLKMKNHIIRYFLIFFI